MSEFNHYSKKEIIDLYQNPKIGLIGKTEFAKKINADPDIVEDALHELDSYTVNAKNVHRFPTMKTLSIGLDYQWQADLVDLQLYANDNDGFKYLFTAIDVASRFAFARAIKDKTAETVKNAFQSILTTSKRKPEYLQTDIGSEFTNQIFQRFLKNNNIIHFIPPTNSNAAIVERFHLTLKLRMTKLFTLRGNYKYIDHLQDIVYNYNNTFHSVIKMKPLNVNSDNVLTAVSNSNSNKRNLKHLPTIPKFHVDDYVRITRNRHTFARSVDDKYTFEIFKIHKVFLTEPFTYSLIDLNNNIINGRFYEPELIKVSGDVDNREWKIHDIIDKRGNKVLVQWLGFGDDFNGPFCFI